MEETPLDETSECRRSRCCCLPCKEYLLRDVGIEGEEVDAAVAVMTESALSSSEVRAATQRSRSGPFCNDGLMG